MVVEVASAGRAVHGGAPGGLPPLQQLLFAGGREIWATAALVLALREGTPPDLAGAAGAVLATRGLDPAAPLGEHAPPAVVAAQAAAGLIQAAAVVSGRAAGWADQPDEALLAQGRASSQGAAFMVREALPRLPGLADALARPGARVLDVGTGTGALATAYAEALPGVTVVGIDVLPRVLALAERVVAASPAADRVELREQDVTALAEEEVYDLAWMPAPFLPEPAFRAGLRAVVGALRPGGWLVVGHGRATGDPDRDALDRFTTLVYGGTPLDERTAERELTAVGLVDVTHVPTPTVGPAVVVGRRPR